MNAKELFELGDNLFGKKSPLNSLHQEIADAFYPERAIFTLQRSLGMDFAANLMTSFPVLCRRDLGNQIGAMLRPSARPWFHCGRRYVEKETVEIKQWLQGFEETQRKAMYDPKAALSRATKEGDHDFAAFGQCAISIELNRDRDTLLYRCWHLKDMAWQESDDGQIGPRFRRWKPTALQLSMLFPKEQLHSDIVRAREKNPFEECSVMHIVVPTEMYDRKVAQPWYSIWWDVDHQCVIEENGLWTGHYRIPRWQTVSGSQYSYSPATVAALPDARLIQAMTFTLLEAGEKATSPPMIATVDAVRSDLALYANGVTWVDPEYDEKQGAALRPLTQDFRGFNFGVEMTRDARSMISEAFYLNKLTMPARGPEMTAYEVGQRVQQYIRDALPIFEPMEMEYNAGLCEDTFELLVRNGAFGSPYNWPRQLRGHEISFQFESPLHDAIEEQKGQKLIQGEQLMASAIKLDPSIINMIDSKTALRDALLGIGWEANWLRTQAQTQEIEDQQKQQAQVQQLLESMQKGAGAARDLGAASESFAAARPVAA